MSSTPIADSVLASDKWKVICAVPQGAANITVSIRMVSLLLVAGTNVPVYLARVPVTDTTDQSNYTPAPQYNIQPPGILLGPGGSVAGIIEDTGIVIPAGWKIVARTDTFTSEKLAISYHGYTGDGA